MAESNLICPWCHKEISETALLIETAVTEREEFSPEQFFLCPHCKKNLKRVNNRERSKRLARKSLFLLFFFPLAVWFFSSNVFGLNAHDVLIVTVVTFMLSGLLFRVIVFSGGQDIIKG